MNEFEKQNPLFPEDENSPLPSKENEDIPVFYQDIPAELPEEDNEYSFEPIKSVAPEEAFSEAASPEASFPEETSSTPYEAPVKPTEEKSDTTFNPYASAPSASSTNYSGYAYKENNPAFSGSTNPYQPPENHQQSVNTSYNQPLNQGYNNVNGNQQNNFTPYQQPPAPSGNKNGKLVATIIIAVCVIVGAIALVSSFLGDKPSSETQTTTAADQSAQTTVAVSQGAVISTTQASAAIDNTNSVWVADKVRPVVVGVLAYNQGQLAGEGSGVLMSEDTAQGITYIITCAHVIDDPSCDFSVLLLDGKLYDADVVALDARTDIGVLKIKATGLPLAEFGDSSSLKIGEPIYAIGNPGGSEYFGSITNGIVSAIDRSISATYTMTCIQHNAAINPGNSGGALVNSAGQIIGINSSKIAKTDFEGMGFAVPSAIFKPVVDALIQHGYVPNRPELGIKYASLSDYQLYSLIVSIKGLPKESIIIAEIPEGSALSGTAAQVGDLIIAVNGKKMDDTNVLLDMIDTGAVGDTLTLTLCRIKDRSYETSTFDVTVQLVEDKGSITTTTQAPTLPQQGGFGNFGDEFGDFFDFFGW